MIRNTNALIIPIFKTSADGCGFFLPKDLIKNRISTNKSSAANKSFIIKNRFELAGKKSNR